MSHPPTMVGQVPPHYEEVVYWKLGENKKQYILINLISIPLGLGVGIFCFWLLFLWGGDVSGTFDLRGVVWLIAAVALTLMLHEWIHGQMMKRFGATPQYGFKPKLLALYATAPGHAFTRNQYVQILLAPLVLITLLAVGGMVLVGGTAVGFILALCASFNATGACGDVYMTYFVCRYPAHAYVIDEEDGLRVFRPFPS
jgi:hypothetical protein